MNTSVMVHGVAWANIARVSADGREWVTLRLLDRSAGVQNIDLSISDGCNALIEGPLIAPEGREVSALDKLREENLRLTKLLDEGQCLADEVINACEPEDWRSLIDSLGRWWDKANQELHKQGKDAA